LGETSGKEKNSKTVPGKLKELPGILRKKKGEKKKWGD